jgi:hypothetical protein
MRRFLAAAFVLALGAAVSGCASPIQSMMLTEDTALVSAIGHKPEDQGKVVDASLQEAARLTASKGFRYFVIMDAADASKMGSRFEAPMPSARDRNVTTPTAFSGQLITTPVYRDYFKFPGRNVAFVRPGIDITIRMYREGEIDPKSQGVWSAADLLKPPATASRAAP